MPLDDTEIQTRSLPNSVEAEQAVLGALMVNNEVLHRISRLSADHFYDPLHGEIFRVMAAMIDRGEEASPITLKPIFANDEAMEKVGGTKYLLNLVGGAITVFNAPEHARLVIDMARRRQIIRVGEDMADSAGNFASEETSSELLDRCESALFDLQERGEQTGAKPLAHHLRASIEAVNAAFQSDDEIVGIPSGLLALDRKLSGFQRGDVTIVAGRPSMGKTALSRWIAFSAALKGHGTLMLSLEMSGAQIGSRTISDALRRDGEKIAYSWARSGFYDERTKTKSETAFRRWIEKGREIEQTPFLISDAAETTPAAVRRAIARAAHTMRQQGRSLDLVMIDYLQLMSDDGRRGNRTEELTRITKGLKQVAKFYDAHLLIPCQLSRRVEDREDKTPQLADLRESGSIEQDADNVIGIVRPEYYLERARPSEGSAAFLEWEQSMAQVRGIAQLALLKVRNGPIGVVEVKAEMAFDYFEDLPQEREEVML